MVGHAPELTPALTAAWWKPRLRRLLLATPASHVLTGIHRELTRVEVFAAAASDKLLGRPEPLSMRNSQRVTAIVKTFERPRELRRLLASLSRLFPSVPVIVADDSREVSEHDGVRTLRLSFDVGVSAGRQAALAEVATEYTFVLDDDFVLYGGTRLARVLAILDANPQLDILGGPVIDLPLLRKQSGTGAIYPTQARPVLTLGAVIGGVQVRDKVPNFFVARTERLKLVGWDPALKRLDHADFFTRARGVLVTAYDDTFRCLHAQTPFNREYMAQRMSFDGDAALLSARYFGGRAPL